MIQGPYMYIWNEPGPLYVAREWTRALIIAGEWTMAPVDKPVCYSLCYNAVFKMTAAGSLIIIASFSHIWLGWCSLEPYVPSYKVYCSFHQDPFSSACSSSLLSLELKISFREHLYVLLSETFSSHVMVYIINIFINHLHIFFKCRCGHASFLLPYASCP